MNYSYVGTLQVGPLLLVELNHDAPPFIRMPFDRGNILILYLNTSTAVSQSGKGWTVELDRYLSLEDEQAILGYVVAAFATIADGSNKPTVQVRVGLEHRVHKLGYAPNEGYIPGVNGIARFRVSELPDSYPVRVDSICPQCDQNIAEADLGDYCQGRI